MMLDNAQGLRSIRHGCLSIQIFCLTISSAQYVAQYLFVLPRKPRDGLRSHFPFSFSNSRQYALIRMFSFKKTVDEPLPISFLLTQSIRDETWHFEVKRKIGVNVLQLLADAAAKAFVPSEAEKYWECKRRGRTHMGGGIYTRMGHPHGRIYSQRDIDMRTEGTYTRKGHKCRGI